MVRRRRPLLPEEWAARQRRQMSTGRGQANAKPVKVSAARTRTVRAAAPATALAGLGYFQMDAGTFAGDALGDGSFNTLYPTSQTDALTGGAAATWDSTFGRFVIGSAGLWVMFAYVIVDGVTSGAVHVQTPLFTDGPADLFVNYNGDLGGGHSIAGGLSTPPVVAGVGDHFSADVYVNGTSPTVAGCQLLLYPIALL